MNEHDVYGWAAHARRRSPAGLIETVEIRRIGRRRVVERAARLLSGFLEIESCEPLTRAAYERAFGVPRRT